MNVQPYLIFEGRCEEAIEFYRRALGAEVQMLMRFKEAPERNPACMPPDENKVMHSSFRIGDTVVLASDGRCSGTPNFAGVALTLNVPDEPTAQRFFAALGDGGQVQMPLTKTFFSPCFGMVADRFGLNWMIHVPQAQ